MKKLQTILLILVPILALSYDSKESRKMESKETEETPVLTSIKISPSSARLDIVRSETIQLQIEGLDQFEKTISIKSNIVWTSSNDALDVDENGLVISKEVGNSTVTVEVEDISKSIDIRVWDSLVPRTDVFVSDAGNFDSPPWQILVYDDNGENPYVFTNQHLAWPQDILVLEDQELVLISNLNSGTITKYDVNSGEYKGDFASGIGGPTRMKIGPDGFLYVLQWQGNGLVKRYDLDGKFINDFTSVGVNQSIGLGWDTEGNLYVSSYRDKTVRKFDTQGSDLGIFIGSNLNGPTNIWFDGLELYVNDYSAGSIKKFDENGGLITIIASGLSEVEGVDFFQDGRFIVGNGGNGSVKMYQSDGAFVKDFVTPKLGGLIRPNAVRIRSVNQ